MSAQPTATAELYPAALRVYWHDLVKRELMRTAGLMNLVPYGETDISKLPANVHTIALKLVGEQLLEACRQETVLGRRSARTWRMVCRQIHITLAPFARRGEFYVEHLVGDAETRREARVRLEGDGS